MSITIELRADEEQQLQAEALDRHQSIEEYVRGLIYRARELPGQTHEADADVDDDADEPFIPSPRLAAKMEEARKQIHAQMEADPEFAEMVRRPMCDEVPLDEVIIAARTRRFSDQAVEETYGKEFADWLRQQLRG